MSNQPDVCLGCGNTYLGAYCLECEARATHLIQTSHWPLETSLSPTALEEVENAIRYYMADTGRGKLKKDSTYIELSNLANNIRSHLQHVQKDPLLQ
jgi:hypothetical protein